MEPHPNANKKPFDVSDKKFKKLCADIRKNGMQEEIVICDDKLLDGRYRQAAIKKLYADGSLPENFEVKYRIHADTETYLAKDVNLSQNYLRQNHTQFECAVACVWDNWHLHGPLSEAAKARKLKGGPAKKNERGTVDEKFAEMAGVNENYASIAIGLRKYDERLREVVDREQLNHSTAPKFNRLTKKQKGKYLQYFLGNPTANFADAHSEFKEEEKKKAEKPNKVKVYR